MTETSISLLERLHDRTDQDSWQRLVDLYTPLISRWLQRFSVNTHEAEDLAQEVLLAVVRDVGSFRHNGLTGAFRAWLRTITVNRLRAFWRSRKHRGGADGGRVIKNMLDQLEDPQSGISRVWDEEHDRFITERLFSLVEPEFQHSTWRAFYRVVKEGQKPAVVAAELRMSINAVMIAKSRVLRRLRQEMRGLMDASSVGC